MQMRFKHRSIGLLHFSGNTNRAGNIGSRENQTFNEMLRRHSTRTKLTATFIFLFASFVTWLTKKRTSDFPQVMTVSYFVAAINTD